MIIRNIPKSFYRKMIGLKNLPPVKYTSQEASDMIEYGINSASPFFCGRLGSTELQTMIFAERAKSFPLNILLHPFWPGVITSVHNSSGVFNAEKKTIYEFTELYKNLMPAIDILGSWHSSETFFEKELSHCKRIKLGDIGPWLEQDSWLKSLKDKRVLVVHPFVDTIKTQYVKRELLFKNPNILPQFKELLLVKAVQSVAGEKPDGFDSWFDALYYMKAEMEKVEYDVALIGCGAYGFPLAAWAKQNGRKAVLIGGALQLLFGIKGKRWDSIEMHNPHWVSPSAAETPKCHDKVPGSAYW